MSDENVEFETVELEYSEDDILYYIVDENDEEIGFAIMEDGKEVEYYYEGFDGKDYETVEEIVEEIVEEVVEDEDGDAEEDEADKNPSYLRKMATIAGAEADKLRGKAEKKADAARSVAEKKAKQAAKAAKSKAKELKDKAEDEYDLGITRDDVAETTADLNAIAREGAETAAELKEAYDDIMESFSFLKKR